MNAAGGERLRSCFARVRVIGGASSIGAGASGSTTTPGKRRRVRGRWRGCAAPLSVASARSTPRREESGFEKEGITTEGAPAMRALPYVRRRRGTRGPPSPIRTSAPAPAPAPTPAPAPVDAPVSRPLSALTLTSPNSPPSSRRRDFSLCAFGVGGGLGDTEEFRESMRAPIGGRPMPAPRVDTLRLAAALKPGGRFSDPGFRGDEFGLATFSEWEKCVGSARTLIGCASSSKCRVDTSAPNPPSRADGTVSAHWMRRGIPDSRGHGRVKTRGEGD